MDGVGQVVYCGDQVGAEIGESLGLSFNDLDRIHE
jgi:hypothetical protein